MSRNAKIALVVFGTLFTSSCLLALAAVLVAPRALSNMFTTDSDRAKGIAAQIADYTLPSDYQEQIGMDLITYKLVAIGRADKRGLGIMLMQFSTFGVSREQMERQMQQSFQSSFQRNAGALTPVGTQVVTIKGQPVTLTISEGTTTRDQLQVRQAIGTFSGKAGPTMLMVYGSVRDWEQPMLDRFFASIR
ncbi:MAG: hypothetical protein LC737_10110 [Chloroflexi bacterium]|nr:hypothetical protein [Chloroflexota bacterium]